ncbi:hypothetical protein BMJ30_27740 [Sinorhizobium medicae]|uniref:hypothetical protein n=1 Tax=Sinorhizobium medicae TaxID=110321 RepID=UPI000C79FD12|nr:hypothetical protein [Sinorhizobium medicae]PLU12404.1 hypothetical protein BMJ30_27740 [Sinorhizobium medicae]PLU26082.1 hypothetical protein BMJ27_34660 [Sinorhizobium medicae]
MSDAAEGKRFSQLYLRSQELLPDSQRMRNRLAIAITELDEDLSRLGKRIEKEHGVLIGECRYDFKWPPILKKLELRDVLDAITTIYNTITHHSELEKAKRRGRFLMSCRRIFAEEQVRYRIDDRGGVHFTVDQQFESTRVSTIASLSSNRYNGVRSLYEDAFVALDRTPPDGKAALRSAFFAAESLFRLMFPAAHQFSAGEVQKHLEPLVNRLYADEKPAIYLAQKLVASLRDWIDGAHFYRHEPGAEEPAQPPLELAIYMLSEAGGHLRWLAKLDAIRGQG